MKQAYTLILDLMSQNSIDTDKLEQAISSNANDLIDCHGKDKKSLLHSAIEQKNHLAISLLLKYNPELLLLESTVYVRQDKIIIEKELSAFEYAVQYHLCGKGRDEIEASLKSLIESGRVIPIEPVKEEVSQVATPEPKQIEVEEPIPAQTSVDEPKATQISTTEALFFGIIDNLTSSISNLSPFSFFNQAKDKVLPRPAKMAIIDDSVESMEKFYENGL